MSTAARSRALESNVAGSAGLAGPLAIYSAAVVLGACLLFLVQPLIAKIILPWFGGASSVWSAALLFFQACVLVGYAYAHWLATRARPAVQGVVHAALLVAACLLMPILPSEAWRPVDASDPTLRILALLAATVGLPAVLLSSTSPLIQWWFMRRTGSEVPYWLFALSNFGSMAALLSFPFLLEPAFGVRSLALGWSVAFVVFAALSVCAAWLSRVAERPRPSETERSGGAPSAAQMALWVVLAACASGLLIAVSAQLTTNVAPIPLLWVAPLALYLLTFIVSFGAPRFYNPARFFSLLIAAVGCMAYLYAASDSNLHVGYVIPLYLAGLTVCCMVCHGELVHRRPAPPFLTRFYLLIAFGGALGGVFAAVLAPNLFDTYLELPLLLVLLAAVSVWLQWRRRGARRVLWALRAAMLAGVVVLAAQLAQAEIAMRRDHLIVTRNFYGVLRVRDELLGMELARRNFLHGTISHGSQFLGERYRDAPSSYFTPRSGIERTLQALKAQGPVRYGVIGLGAGVLAGYAGAGDYVRIYEINPAVLDIANERFTFLSHAKDAGADIEVLLGDGRLTLEREPPQSFDLLIVDAFSSDAIPTHLLTHEAIDLYFRHLKPDGVLAVQISNRYLDLTPVCFRAAERVGRTATVIRSPGDGMASASVWVLITSNAELLARQEFADADLQPATAPLQFRGWTDQYSSVWRVLDLSRPFERGD